MSRANEFLQFVDFNNQLKRIQKSRKDTSISFSEENAKAYALRKQIRTLYGFSEIDFRTWLRANEEFLKVLTKEEKHAIRYAIQQFEATDKVEDLSKVLDLVRESNYSDFITQYMEDYSTETN